MLTNVVKITPVEVWMRLKSAELLKAQMRVQGQTTRSLAAAVECSRGFIGDLCRERSNKKTCSPNLAHRIAAELDTDVSLLFFAESSKDATRNAKAKAMESRARISRGRAA